MWDAAFGVGVAGTDAGSRRLCVGPRLGSAGVQLTQRALDFLHRNPSHTCSRTTLTLSSLQRSRGGITLKDTLMPRPTQGHSNNANRWAIKR